MSEFSLVLPVVNEADIIEAVVREIEHVLRAEKINYELILVENQSTDDTLRVLRKLSKNNSRIQIVETRRGYGSAVLAGLQKANGKYVGYMPSDGQIDPKILPDLLKYAKSKNYDLVKVRRKTRENIIRFLRSRIFNILAHLLFHIPTWDINGSPRIFLRTALPTLELSFRDSFIDTEFAIKAKLLNWKIKELPIYNRDRIGGESTVSIKTVVEFVKNLFSYRFSSSLKDWRKKHLLNLVQ